MINLLPPELALDRGFGKLAKSLKSLTLLSVVVLVIFALGLVGYIIFSSIRLNSLTTRILALETSIKNEEVSEQRLVLLKDRLAKIKTTEGLESSDRNLEGVTKMLTLMGSSPQVSDLTVDTQKADVSIIFRNSQELGSFFRDLVANSPFKSVVLTSFGFNPSTGYLVGLRFLEKI